MNKLAEFLRDESGATAIEYALIASFIAIAIVSSVKGIGTNLNSTFNKVSSNLH
jgi:pilus assembly protein Flp/PilA